MRGETLSWWETGEVFKLWVDCTQSTTALRTNTSEIKWRTRHRVFDFDNELKKRIKESEMFINE